MKNKKASKTQKTAAKSIAYLDVKTVLNKNISQKTLLKLGTIVLVLGLISGGVWYFNRAYADRIYPKVLIAGMNVGGLTKEQAKTKVEEKINELNNKGPEITYNEQKITPKLDEMGLTFDAQKIVDEAFAYGRDGNLKEKTKANYKLLIGGLQFEIKPQIDEEKFNGYLSQLASVVEKEPVNAVLSINNGQIELTSSEKGRGLDKEKLKVDLTELINYGQTVGPFSGKITMATSDLEPAITEEGATDARTQAEIYMAAAPITVTFENSSWAAGRSEIGSWIKFSENDHNLVATVHPSTFVNWIANQVEIPAADREIEDVTGTVLSEGQDGRGMEENTLTAQITQALKSGQPGSFALATYAIARGQKTIYPHAQPGRYAGRYIDINLSEQTLYAFEGSTIVNQFLISSGKRGYATPTGEFAVYDKTSSQLMDGPDYYLPNVPWISWFNGEISIHGTYWHSNFGTPMSHGCINASISDAEWIYNWDDIGTPVYVHY